jgi:hypothetical protein
MRADCSVSVTRCRWIAILLVLPHGFACAEAHQALTWWGTNPLTRVKPRDPAPQAPEKRAIVYAGRNEFEPCQLSGLSGLMVLKQNKGRYTIDDDVYALTRLFEKAALLHRICIYGGSGIYADRIVQKSYVREDRSAMFLRARQKMGEALNRRTAPESPWRTDAQ